ncbi:MAG: hypothetical protein EBV05_07640 [Cyanobacteria bacterium WB6_1B_304]|nr:hypothetical protein [Cyanobacteria bacterium WB6_1B_304]
MKGSQPLCSLLNQFPPVASSSDRQTIRTLWSQFRTLYPHASLTAELIHNHENYYIVMSVIHIDGVVASSGMGAGESPEIAEDNARTRALEILGIYPSLSTLESGLPLLSPPLLPNSSQSPPEPVSQGEPHRVPNKPLPAQPKTTPKPVQSGESSELNPPELLPSFDLSDVIAQTDVEIRRLNWTVKQGQEHLQNFYHKKSRQQLTDDELLDFLEYLQSLP